MATKDYWKQFKDKHDSTSNDSADVYRNFTLNKNHKCTTAFDQKRSKSVENGHPRNSNYERTAALIKGLLDDVIEKTASQKDGILLKKFHKNLSKNYFNTNFNDAKEERKAKNNSSSSSSTLSLHIAAYENFIDSQVSDSLAVKELKKKSTAISTLENPQQQLSGSSCSDHLEFPRQQESSNESKKPEVQQFAASQKLFTPFQESFSHPVFPKSSEKWVLELNQRFRAVRGDPTKPGNAKKIAEREALMLELRTKYGISGDLDFLKDLEKQLKQCPSIRLLLQKQCNPAKDPPTASPCDDQGENDTPQPPLQMNRVEQSKNIIEPNLTTAIEDDFHALAIQPTPEEVSTDPTQSDRSSSMDSFPCFTPTRSDISVASSFHSLPSPFNTPGRIGYDELDQIREKVAEEICEKKALTKSASTSMLDKSTESLNKNQSSGRGSDSYVAGVNDSPRTAEAKKKCQRKKLELDQAVMEYGAARLSLFEARLRRRSTILKLNLKGKGRVSKKKNKK